jgi:hypothetical protein
VLLILNMTTTYSFSNNMSASSCLKNLGADHVLYSQLLLKKAGVSDIYVSHITPHQGSVKLKILSPNPPVHPLLIVPLEEAHIYVGCPFCNEADILF